VNLRIAAVSAVAVALLATALPASAAPATVNVSGLLEVAATVTVYRAPGTIVAEPEVLATASVAAGAFQLAIPADTAAYVAISPTSAPDLVAKWWVGAGGTTAGAYALLSPIAVGETDVALGTLARVASGSLTAALENGARTVCVLREDGTVVTCDDDPHGGTAHTFAGLYPGIYLLSTAASTMVPSARVIAGTNTYVDFTEGGVIIGSVKDAKGHPVVGVTVATQSEDGTHRVADKTDATGRYELSALAEGVAELTVTTAISSGSENSLRPGWAGVGVAGTDKVRVTVERGRVSNPKAIVLHKKGKVAATLKVSRTHIGDLYIVKGDQVVAQVYLQGTDKRVSTYVKPGTYRYYFVDKNGARRYASRKVIVREGHTTALGTVAFTKATKVVTGAVPTLASGTVKLRLSSQPDAGTLASGAVRDGRYTIRSVVPGVYWATAQASPSFVSEKTRKLTVTRSRSGIVIEKPRKTEVPIALSLGGIPLGTGLAHLRNYSPEIGVDGRVTIPWRGTKAQSITVTSPALGDRTPYWFTLSDPEPDLATIPTLSIGGIGGA
jgi:hypothetical protein